MVSPDLRAKYGDAACNLGVKMQGEFFATRLAERDALDQHFTKQWLDFAISGLAARPALDIRTRMLVLIGQYVMAKSQQLVDDTVRAALANKVAPREILEIILQCAVYGGHTTVDPAIRTFYSIAKELNLLGELKASQLPLDGTDSTRKYDDEFKTWHKDDTSDPRFKELMEMHGWLAVGRGLSLRPQHHLNILEWLTKIDPHFAGLWVKFCYGGMYSRFIVDDKTRLLCMVGDCLAVGEATQARGHMRGSMRNGAKATEVMEVILQTAANFGMPPMLHALEVFVQVMAAEGRLSEIGNPAMKVESYAK
ncbi:MAG TPA: carboxymuconolactone decarboxylase family protein [Burkholderiales bacterium]|jgi:alkylhydroperoxidase/carboxymuconolactone decarboxylase family protein YurZ|nr:carboxymuconolactone decarboxylase family protein [Burkholderiales bacterium]